MWCSVLCSTIVLLSVIHHQQLPHTLCIYTYTYKMSTFVIKMYKGL